MMSRLSVDDRRPVVAVEPVELEHQEVRHGGADMGRGHGADRRGDVVRREGDVVDLGQVGDLAALREPAAFRDVGHDDVDRLLLDQLAETVAQIEILAGADRRGGGALDLAHGVDVLGRHRLLEPHQVQRLEVAGQPDGARHVEPRVDVAGDVDLLARRLSSPFRPA